MIYSIGHGNKSKEDFLEELRVHNIQYLIDVRSKPFSKFNPQFNQHELKFLLEENGVEYVFLGDQLGGLPSDRSCYTHEGKVDYSVVKDKPFFLEGLQRLVNADENNVTVAIMCSESKPQDCHRSKLIGRELQKRHVQITHIVGKDKTKDQATVLLEATKGRGERTLFDDDINLTSKRKYA